MSEDNLHNRKLILPLVVLSGTPFEMGRAFGSINPVRVLDIYESRLAKLIEYAAEDGVAVTEADALGAVRKCLPVVEAYTREGFEELSALAAVCGMTLEQVWLINAYTDLRDYMRFAYGGGAHEKPRKAPELEGCSAFFASADSTPDEMPLMGQTWDLGTEDMERVVAQHRKPKDAPEVWAITVIGAQPMIGMNEHGISCLTNDLNSGDGRPGVCYLDILSKVLRQSNLDSAINCVTHAPRLGGHHYIIADGEGNAAAIETSALAHTLRFVDRGVYVHTNHYLEPDIKKFERTRPPSSTPRWERMTKLLRGLASADGGADEPAGANGSGDGADVSRRPGITPEAVQKVYADREGEYCINRYDDDTGSSTNACLIMSPVKRKLWMCRGQADRGEWIEAEFGWPEEGEREGS